jgi:hypothetical protein
MAFIQPYITDKFTSYKGDIITTLFSVAIWLIDDYAGKEPIGHVRITIKEGGIEAIKNLSGYYIFTDLAIGSYTVDIFSDLYFPEEKVIDTSKIKTSNVILNFDTTATGPASGATSTKLKDVSILQIGDVVEFHNSNSDVEQKNITAIDIGTKTISWSGGLNHDFSAAGSTILALANPDVTILLKPLPSYPFPNHATLVRGLLIDSGKNPVVDATVKVASQNIETKSDINGEFVLYFNKIQNKNISISIGKNGNAKSVDTTLEEGIMESLGKIVFP